MKIKLTWLTHGLFRARGTKIRLHDAIATACRRLMLLPFLWFSVSVILPSHLDVVPWSDTKNFQRTKDGVRRNLS